MLKTILAQKDLILNLVVNDIKGKYLGSLVGFWGSIINPLLLLLIYCFVFSGILRIKFGMVESTGNFAIYLFCGLLPWMGFSEAVQRSSTVMLDQRALIKRVLFPKEVLPFYLTISTFISQVIALVVFMIVLFAVKAKLGGYALFLLFVFPLQVLFAFGFSLCIASLNVFFRDIGVFLGTFLQIWFFCTPIFYPESLIPTRFMGIMELNPILHLVRIYREILLQNSLPNALSFTYFFIASVLIFLSGSFVFSKVKDRIVDHL